MIWPLARFRIGWEKRRGRHCKSNRTHPAHNNIAASRIYYFRLISFHFPLRLVTLSFSKNLIHIYSIPRLANSAYVFTSIVTGMPE